MRVFYLITKSEAGGAQTHISQLARFMRDQGHQVAVMAYPGGWLEEKIPQLGGAFYPNIHLHNALNPFEDVLAGQAVAKAVSDFKPDLVSCHSSKAGVVGRLTIRGRIPTLFTAHGWAFTEGAGLLRRSIAVAAESVAAPYAKKIICVSEHDRDLALRYRIASGEKLLVIHNGVETDVERAHPADYARRIVFVGRLAHPKLPQKLVEAAAMLTPDLRKEVRVDLIGEGPYRESLGRLIADKGLAEQVHLIGNVPREKVFERLGSADAFVLLSAYEGLPRSILEAMSAGLPIVASDVGGVREMVNTENGFVIPRDNTIAVAKALTHLMSDLGEARRMGEVSRVRVEEEFSLDTMLKKTYEVYKEVLT